VGVNILVIERTFPWPEVNGTSIRVANIVRALARLGDVDFFLIPHGGTASSTPVPSGEPVARMGRAPRAPRRGLGGLRVRQLTWLGTSTLPFSVATRDYSGVRSAFLAWARPHYDLVWIGRAHAYVPLAGLIDAATVVDFDDLEDRKIRAWLDVASDAASLANPARPSPAATRLIRSSGARLLNSVNLRRWRALEHRIANAVDAVVVCSDLDRQRLGVANGVVIPNAYAPPARAVGRVEVGRPPTILLVGALTYAPNADAARFLVREVLPRVRGRLPGTHVRLIGHHEGGLTDLAEVSGVTFTGFVPDVSRELAYGDVAAVPVRFGGGTRVKILEAFAHRIPVVSTSLGCEGIDTTDGRHLLIADDPEGFASACVEAIVNMPLRRALIEAAHSLYWSRYRPDVVARRIMDVASAVAAGHRPSAGEGDVAPGRIGRSPSGGVGDLTHGPPW
jgi:glycosyltransferase involved in cell wall biosynthesis